MVRVCHYSCHEQTLEARVHVGKQNTHEQKVCVTCHGFTCVGVCVSHCCLLFTITGAVFFVTVAMLGLNVWGALIIIAVVFMILVNMGGAMALFGITANAVSLVNLVMVSG